jgi:hypothetical protein
MVERIGELGTTLAVTSSQAALGLGVYSPFNRNEYQKLKNNLYLEQ